MTLAELTRPLTPDEIRAAIYAAIAARGGNPTAWKPGSPTRTIIAGLAIVLAGLSGLIAAIAKSGFLELAEGDWLTVVARYVFFVERGAGTFATGSVVIDNAGGGVFELEPGDLIVISSATGKGYRNTAAVSIGALATGVAVPVQALELGSDSTAVPGAIDDFETPLPGLSVTNPNAIVGADPESDAELRERCLAKTGTLSPNGPRDAYVFVAKSAVRASGERIGVTRVRTIPDGIGGVDVYVARADGTVSGDANDPATDLGAVAAAIHTQVEPLAITPRVQGAALLPVAVTYQLWVRDTSGLTNPQIETAVSERLTEFFATQPIGGHVIPGETTGRVYVSAIAAVIGATLPGREVRVSVTSPAADVDVAVAQAPVIDGAPVATITQVAGGVL